MTDEPEGKPDHWIKHEPKFCRCRVCHERFYGATLDEARQACRAHAGEQHPAWGPTACFCAE